MDSNAMDQQQQQQQQQQQLTLVVRKACFGLPTACPICLPVYIYLRFSNVPFNLDFNLIHPDSDQIPYVEYGTCVAYNNEKSGVIDSLKEDGIVDLDSQVFGVPDWVSTKAMVSSWLADAIMYELWVDSDGRSAYEVYYSDLPWPIGKFLYLKQVRLAKQVLGLTKDNTDQREEEIYKRAGIAYAALSVRLGEQTYFFHNRPTSLDALFLGHALFTLEVLSETSVLRSKLLEHTNLVRYAEKLKAEFVESGPSSTSIPLHSDPLSASKHRSSNWWNSKPRNKPKREKTEEEKKFRRRAKYFLVTQLVAVLVFLSLLGGYDDAETELDGDEEGLHYD